MGLRANIMKLQSYFILFTFVFVTAGLSWAQDVSFEMRPNHIDIGTFYNGTKVTVTGKVPAGSNVVIRVSGHYTDIHLKKKGKVGGLLWMNVSDVTIKNVPEVFMVLSSPRASMLIDDPRLNLGYKYLEKMMGIEPEDEDKGFIFNEFIKLQEKIGTYGVLSGVVKLGQTTNGFTNFEAVIPVPPKMKPGSYKVEVFAIKDNVIAGVKEASLTLKQVGFPALVSKLAFEYSLLYGIGAVIIAVCAGLLMGVLFRGKGGAH